MEPTNNPPEMESPASSYQPLRGSSSQIIGTEEYTTDQGRQEDNLSSLEMLLGQAYGMALSAERAASKRSALAKLTATRDFLSRVKVLVGWYERQGGGKHSLKGVKAAIENAVNVADIREEGIDRREDARQIARDVQVSIDKALDEIVYVKKGGVEG